MSCNRRALRAPRAFRSPDWPARLLVVHDPGLHHAAAQLKELAQLVLRVACLMQQGGTHAGGGGVGACVNGRRHTPVGSCPSCGPNREVPALRQRPQATHLPGCQQPSSGTGPQRPRPPAAAGLALRMRALAAAAAGPGWSPAAAASLRGQQRARRRRRPPELRAAAVGDLARPAGPPGPAAARCCWCCRQPGHAEPQHQ
jgi:hypothetical protein